MKNKKLHINFKYLSSIFILFFLASCGSFDSSSLVSSDGIYAGNESSKETLKPKSDYFKNYFSDESSKYDLNLLESDSLNFDSYSDGQTDGLTGRRTDRRLLHHFRSWRGGGDAALLRFWIFIFIYMYVYIYPPPRLARTAFLIVCFTSSFPTDTCLPLKLLKGPEVSLPPEIPRPQDRLETSQDAHKSDLRCLLFGIPFLMPLEIDFNAILGTNLHPKTHQNPLKMDAKKPSILGFNF